MSAALALLNAVVAGLWVNALTDQANRNTSDGGGSLASNIAALGWWNLLLPIMVGILLLEVHRDTRLERHLGAGADRLVTRIIANASKTFVFPHPTKHIRAIVTVCVQDGEHRETRYTYNTAQDPERVASYDNEFGVTGVAFTTRSTIVDELEERHHEEYDDVTKKAVLPQIKTIMASPLLTSTHPSDDPLGVLAFDSVLEPGRLSFDKPMAREISQEWADIVATLLCLKESGEWPSI